MILGIESSCDETAAAVVKEGKILANVVAGQAVHSSYGGVVPELASRAHQSNIVPVVHEALKQAGIKADELEAIAYTIGPGLMGSLLVGGTFSKALALSLNIPLVPVNHMHGHISSIMISGKPEFPFLCLTVSGGHTQIVKVDSMLDMTVLGETTDDAAGEAFDKAAKILGLPYPGGPLVDKYAGTGDPKKYRFPKPQVPGLNFSFSGLKTSFLNFINTMKTEEKEKYRDDICASYQHTIVEILIEKLTLAVAQTGIKRVGIAGGVAANSGLRAALERERERSGWDVHIPEFKFCTDNAAMIAFAGYYLLKAGKTGNQRSISSARLHL